MENGNRRGTATESRCVRYAPPVQRAPVRLFNTVGRGLRQLGLSPAALSEESLCATARRRTGLGDFGDEAFREPLRVLIGSLEAEARLSPFGRAYARTLLVQALVNRLRLQRDWTRHPDILDEKIRQPWFVLGLPRSGTTLLLNLLASDPAHRWLAFWEAREPSPPPTRETYATDPRRRRALRYVAVLDYLAPTLLAMHEFDANGPEECFPLLANTFAGVQFSWMFDVPSFDAWLAAHDPTAGYLYYRRQLQLLQWRCRGARWVLKSPTHLWALDAIRTAFPDARIVQLHRDPLKVVPSACSLTATMRGLATDDVDARTLGEYAAAGLADGVRRAMEARSLFEAEHVHDVQYLDLVHDPMRVVRGIYERFEAPLMPQAEAAMRRCLAGHPQHKRGVHRYSLEQFDLDADGERRRFAAYCEAFRVGVEP
jgi:hypothetical protein